jgi:xylitol oxidase
VSLGALGAVTRITLDVEATYDVAQHVFEDLGWDALFAHFDEIVASGYSVSVFTLWGDRAGSVWVKRRLDEEPPPRDLFGARSPPRARRSWSSCR